jgi:hypothetical protein
MSATTDRGLMPIRSATSAVVNISLHQVKPDTAVVDAVPQDARVSQFHIAIED